MNLNDENIEVYKHLFLQEGGYIFRDLTFKMYLHEIQFYDYLKNNYDLPKVRFVNLLEKLFENYKEVFPNDKMRTLNDFKTIEINITDLHKISVRNKYRVLKDKLYNDILKSDNVQIQKVYLLLKFDILISQLSLDIENMII
jgi:alpha-amylase/alpha-mannosidase (GH57 family)